MSLAAILNALRPTKAGLAGEIPESWLQGRTAFGGLSAAIALHAARQADADLPPLNSAQIAFIGPLAGKLEARAKLLRRGRTAAFVGCDLVSEQGLGLRATFVFMDERSSAIDHVRHDFPDIPGPDKAQAMPRAGRIAFLQHFDFADVRDVSGESAADWLRWIRLRERDGLDPAVALLALADALPPAALRLVPGFAPISSVTWLANLLTVRPETENGWWLLRSQSDQARAGSSSQAMSVWNTRGERVMAGMQSVAMFV